MVPSSRFPRKMAVNGFRPSEGHRAPSPPEVGRRCLMIRPAVHKDVPELGRLGALLVSLHHDFDPDRFIGGTPNTELA